MFWAALAAQYAGETYVTANRIVAALLRTPSVSELCARAQLDCARLYAVVDDPRTLSFDECERRVMQDLADKGLELGSKEHQATVVRRPLEPAVKPVFDVLLDRQEQFLVPPLELLLELIRADPALAERLGSLSAALEKDERPR
ncbi:MAG TPA: hypothetical protein VEO54_24665 [Thermoanaerobaculia bacterium]|nr:hypothetical protein [Thermoanaerobaculia bacterium]